MSSRAAPLAEGILSYVAAPLVAKNTVIGSLSVESRKAERYSEDEAEFLVDVAKQVGLAVENMLAFEEVARLKARLEQENLYLQEEVKTEHNVEDIIGHTQPMRKVLTALETVAPTDATVLITGETGTGKELAARAIHMLSPRRDHALVKVNCAALPATLIESELFGHERGAFTGAVARKIGRFELADGGTIFLDEIGDLSMDLQAKLLRVLQDGAFERVGGSHTIKVNARVIAATNHDLDKAQQDGQFRADLYYRLNVFPIDMPPLRDSQGRYPPSRKVSRDETPAKAPETHRHHSATCHGCFDSIPVARKRQRTGERHRARDHSQPRLAARVGRVGVAAAEGWPQASQPNASGRRARAHHRHPQSHGLESQR